jgi:adenylate kinase
MLGPPGAGKGTQGELLAHHFEIPHVSTGALLREHVQRGTPIGRIVEEIVNQGDLVPDDLVLSLLREKLEASAASRRGFILDGFPRTLEQAHSLFEISQPLGATVDVAVHLHVNEAELIRRVAQRSSAEHRADDDQAIMLRRLATYQSRTEPVLRWYEKRGILQHHDAERPAEIIGLEIIRRIEALAVYQVRRMPQTEEGEDMRATGT